MPAHGPDRHNGSTCRTRQVDSEDGAAQGIDASEAVKPFDAKPFLHLPKAAELKAGNASRTFLDVERE